MAKKEANLFVMLVNKSVLIFCPLFLFFCFSNSDSVINAHRDLGDAKRDGECLIKGCVPAVYIIE